jgi:DNA-binding transcriptional LysR family regulator
LKRALGVKLIRRTTCALILTQEGSSFFRRARQILSDVEGAAAEVAARQRSLTEPRRISAPVGLGTLHLGSALFHFLDQNPGLEPTLEADDRFVDVVAEGHGAVIRHGPVEDARGPSRAPIGRPVKNCGVSALYAAWASRYSFYPEINSLRAGCSWGNWALHAMDDATRRERGAWALDTQRSFADRCG